MSRFRSIALALAVLACGSSDDEPPASEPFTPGANQSLRAGADLHVRYPIVFHSDRGGLGTFGLYLMSADGGGRDALPVTDPGRYFQPRWSPDARSIAFRSEVEGVSAEVALIEADNGQLVNLTEGEDSGLRNRAPAWSPDGDRIAFDSVREDGGEGIWVVSRLGGAAERLFPDVGVTHREVTWSPDGTRVAYTARMGEGLRRELFVAELDNLAGAVNLTQGRVYAPQFVRWSPDGSRIVFASAAVLPDGRPEPERPPVTEDEYVPPDTELFVSEVETGTLTRLTDNSDIDIEPAWAPDSQSVIYTRAELNEGDLDPDLWIVPIDAPETARSLIDDDDDPFEEGGPDWYWQPGR